MPNESDGLERICSLLTELEWIRIIDSTKITPLTGLVPKSLEFFPSVQSVKSVVKNLPKMVDSSLLHCKGSRGFGYFAPFRGYSLLPTGGSMPCICQ